MSGSEVILYASTANKWGNCPGSASMETRVPREPNFEANAAHWLAKASAKTLTDPGAHEAGPLSFLGSEAPNGMELTREICEAVDVFFQDVKNEMEGCVKGFTSHKVPMKDNPINNCEVVLPAFAIKDKNLIVWSFEYGHTPTKPALNWKLLNYAVLAHSDLSSDYEYHTVTMRVVQPRSFASDPILNWSLGASAIDFYAGELKFLANAATGRDPVCRTSDICSICNAKLICPALAKASAKALEVAHGPVPDEPDENAIALQITLLRNAQKLIKARLSALEGQAIAMCNGGATLPGWTTDQKLGNRRWDPAKTGELEAYCRLMGQDPRQEDFISPTELDRRSGKKGFADMYTIRTPGKVRLVEHTEIETKAEEVFTNVK